MHYYISEGEVYRAVSTYCKSWHSGNQYYNDNYLGYEICQSGPNMDGSGGCSDEQFLKNEAEAIKQIAEDMEFYGLEPNRTTVKLHKQVNSQTSCPRRSIILHGDGWDDQKVQDYFIKRIKEEMEARKKPQPPKNPTYLHTSKAKKIEIKNDCGFYDSPALTKAKKLKTLKKGQVFKVLKINNYGTKPEDLSRLQIEVDGVKGWVTGNQFYVNSCYYLLSQYGHRKIIKVLKDTKIYENPDLTGASEKVSKGTYFIVEDNIADKNGYARFKIKTQSKCKYITTLKTYSEFTN